VICPVCGERNSERARFCSNCGSPLAGTTAPARDARLERYLPQGMLAKLEAARAGRAMQGERRIVTMLFCDVVGSTAMAETLDPEAWTDIMNGAFEILIAPVYRYEGTLARLMGDAIFAFFGAPIAHEDDPRRAVNAGLDIVEGIGVYREKLLADHGLELNVRVGINTGPVIVGEVGSDLRLEYTAMGDAVNVAARMEQTAEPGTVQITDETRRLVEAAFEIEPRGAVEVKGKAEPIEAFRVLGATTRPVGTRAFAGRDAPLVGRERELELLRAAADDVLGGRGRMVCLIGEAGLGKSRLIDEARRYFLERRSREPEARPDPGERWDVWQCVSYDTNRPYAQYRRLLARMLGIRDTDPPDVVRAKLAHPDDGGASAWAEASSRVRRALFDVLEPGEEPLEGEAFRDAILEIVPRFTRFYGSRPRSLIFEDLHWCDEASMDMVIETAKLVEELPLLILFAFRPDPAASSWRLKQWLEVEHPDRTTELVLAPLSAEEGSALVDALLPGDRFDGVRSRILERTEGNPLFVEELAATIRERGTDGGHDADVPSTLQALITARVDTLDEDTRRVLRLASVIGRTFSESVLGAVAGDGEVLRDRLAALEDAGLIGETGATPEREYAFRHSLTQDATYATMLLRERRELHQRVGEALERLYAARLGESAALLARHFEEAGDDERTLRYAAMAGDEAARLHANADAATHYRSAIDAARRLGTAGEPLHHLYPSRGRALELTGRHAEAAATYEAMRALAEAEGDRRSVLGADLSLATLYATATPLFDAARGRATLDRAIALARDLGDRAVESKTLWNLMILNVYGGGDVREALDAGERSLAIARELGAREQIAFTLTDLWRPYVAAGDVRAARASLDEARPMWRELDNLAMLTENLGSAASIARLAGQDEDALALAEEAREVAVRTGNLWGEAYALMSVYQIHIDRADVRTAFDAMRRCIDVAERAGFVPPLAITRADLAFLHAYLGDLHTARDLVRAGFAVATAEQPISLPWVVVARAHVDLLAGELEAAESSLAAADLDLLPEPSRTTARTWWSLARARLDAARADHARAIEIADGTLDRLRRVEIRPCVAEALLLRGTSLAALGRVDEAERALTQSREDAEALGHRRVLWEALSALADVVAARGDPPHAEALRAEARRHVESIAGVVDDEGLRSSFLRRPDVRRLTTSGEHDATA
jgi:class 3 adenylate cyclase/tetratricopeptide (TPR) repeat protein